MACGWYARPYAKMRFDAGSREHFRAWVTRVHEVRSPRRNSPSLPFLVSSRKRLNGVSLSCGNQFPFPFAVPSPEHVAHRGSETTVRR